MIVLTMIVLMMREHLMNLCDKICYYFPFFKNDKYRLDIKRFFFYFTVIFCSMMVATYLFMQYGVDLLPIGISQSINDTVVTSYQVYNNSISNLKESGFIFAVFIAFNNFISCLMLIALGYIKLYSKKYLREFFDKHGDGYANRWLVYGLITYQAFIIGIVAGLCAFYLTPLIIIVGVLPHYIFEIFAISLACASGFYLRGVEYRRLREFLKVIVVLVCILVFSAFVEGYISASLVNYFF